MSQQTSDPTLEEIREIRHRISERFEHKPERLLAHYMEIQKEYESRWVDGRLRPSSSDSDK